MSNDDLNYMVRYYLLPTTCLMQDTRLRAHLALTAHFPFCSQGDVLHSITILAQIQPDQFFLSAFEMLIMVFF